MRKNIGVSSITNYSKLLLLMLAFTQNTYAQTPDSVVKEKETLVFNGYYRGRIDSYDGVNKLTYGDAAIDAKGNVKGVSNDTLYLHQILAGFTYLPAMNWEIKAYMYDSRSWDSSLQADDFLANKGTADEYGASYYDDHHELHETYIRKYNFLTSGLTFSLGRLNLEYGDRRIFAPGAWGNTIGFFWDAAHLSYAVDKNFIDVWYGQTRTIAPDDFSIVEKHVYQGAGIYSHYEKDAFKIEPFAAWRNGLFHEVKPYEKAYYAGARTYDESIGFIYDATYIKATGRYGEKDIDAYAYVAKAGYYFDDTYKTHFTLGTLYASGDTNPNDTTKGTFETPFGSKTGPNYGRMDIMIWSNMRDYQAMYWMNPTKKLSLKAAFHNFSLAEPTDSWYTFGYKNNPGNSYTEIGNEYDLTLKYTATDNLSFTVIGTYLDAGDFITKNNIAQNDATKLFFQFVYKFSTQRKGGE
ncbi:MAG: alginate export family protein [Sulfurimonas sp.]